MATESQVKTEVDKKITETNSETTIPYRQIRAEYDSNTITVYQAYNKQIADAAVAAQRLDASPLFKTTRMTWIKPSWAWVLYRAGYSYKDANQERILALKLSHNAFLDLLRRAELTTHDKAQAGEIRNKNNLEARKASEVVKVQWDPERTVRLDRLSYRSIQIGIPGALSKQWVEDWIVAIEDVTDRARKLKAVLDSDGEIGVQDLISQGLVPVEKAYDLPDDLKSLLRMDAIE